MPSCLMGAEYFSNVKEELRAINLQMASKGQIKRKGSKRSATSVEKGVVLVVKVKIDNRLAFIHTAAILPALLFAMSDCCFLLRYV